MSDSATTVRCMLLPLYSINLLIPNAAVAEIVGYSKPRPLAESSDWFAGVVLWRGVYVPVVVVEEMCEIDSAHVGPRARIAILYNPSKDTELPYLGIHIQDIPRAYLAEAEKMESGTDDELSQYLLSRVDEDQYARFIPNLEVIITDLKREYSPDKLNQLNN
ncbi:MAG: chemotaxis protein CheW [Gammaproteobacteria bacterium]|nr:chemotaxis protein CheW [Gammaproteobacteria bacterium]